MAETTTTNGGLATVFNDIWDRALGVFDKVADFELAEKQIDLVKEARAFESQQALQDLQQTQAIRGGSGGFGGMSTTTLLIVGGLAVAAVLLLR